MSRRSTALVLLVALAVSLVYIVEQVPFEPTGLATEWERPTRLDLPSEWRTSTTQLLHTSWIELPAEAGYSELPLMELGELNRSKLYASAWTAALLRQVNMHPDPETVQSLAPWLRQLVENNFVMDDGFPQLQNLYLYHLLRSSLGQLVDCSACLATLHSLQDSSGLFRWAPDEPPDLAATQVAVELLVALNAGDEIVSVTRKKLQELLETKDWTMTTTPMTLMNETAPLLIASQQLGLQLPPAAVHYIRNLSQQVPAQGMDPLSIEVLLQLAKLNLLIGERLELPLDFREKVKEIRRPEGGYALAANQDLDPQYTYKIQELIELVYGEHPTPEAASWADSLFYGDSWYAGRSLKPNVKDTYYGLMVAELLGETVPNRDKVIRFLRRRVQELIATDIANAVQPKISEELYFAVSGLTLLSANDWPAGTKEWLERALDLATAQGSDGDLRVLRNLTGTAHQIGVRLSSPTRDRVIELLRKQTPIQRAEIEQAYLVAEIALAVDLPIDHLRATPVVETALQTLDHSPTDQAPITLFSWFRTVQMLRILDSARAQSLLPQAHEFVMARMDSGSGIAPTQDLPPSLRSTAEGLMLLSLR